MDLTIRSPLLMNILSDDLLVPVLANGIRIESARPELSAPEHLLHFRMGVKDLLCDDAFDRLNKCGRRQRRNALHEEVDMVFVRPNLDEMNFMTLRYRHAHLFESYLHRIRKDLSPILGRAYDVVEQECLVVPFENMFTHTPMLSHVGAVRNAFTEKATPQQSCEESFD